MSSFNERTSTSSKIIEYLSEYYWNTPEISNKYQIIHYEYGYETHINPEVQEKLRLRQSKTAKHIRFAPDFIVFKNDRKDADFLLEYKVTKTPRYSFKNNQWYFGQVEADAFDNYINLIRSDINIAVIIYCPYHPRPLLCDIPNKNWIYGSRQRTYFSKGSGTDFYNINLNNLMDFFTFMNRYFDIPTAVTSSLLNKDFFNLLKNDPLLMTCHDKNSYYNKPKYKTGFNWNPEYI